MNKDMLNEMLKKKADEKKSIYENWKFILKMIIK